MRVLGKAHWPKRVCIIWTGEKKICPSRTIVMGNRGSTYSIWTERKTCSNEKKCRGKKRTGVISRRKRPFSRGGGKKSQ